MIKFPIKPKASVKSTHPVAEARLRKEEQARKRKQENAVDERPHAAKDRIPTYRKVEFGRVVYNWWYCAVPVMIILHACIACVACTCICFTMSVCLVRVFRLDTGMDRDLMGRWKRGGIVCHKYSYKTFCSETLLFCYVAALNCLRQSITQQMLTDALRRVIAVGCIF